MNKISRLLQPFIIIILLVSVFALVFVAYTQHEAKQHWENNYKAILAIQPQLNNYKLASTLIALRLTHFANATDIIETEFTDTQHNKIEPLEIELYSGMNYVAFWFNSADINDKQILIHLPSWNPKDYRSMTLPFIECLPENQHCSGRL